MYEDITRDVILNRMLARVPDKMDKREGAIIYDSNAPAANELMLVYLELDNILQETFVETSQTRRYTILRAAERGITPYDATYAVLKAESTPTDLDVPIGARFSLEDLNYVITEKIQDGEYQVQCETAGTEGNKLFGALIPIDYVDGLESITITELLIPGEDEEDIDSIKERYAGTFETKAFGGNRKDYIDNTNAISGVGATKVTRVWNRDIVPADLIPSAAVVNWYESVIDTLPDAVKNWLKPVYEAALNKMLTVGGTVFVTIVDSDDYGKASNTLINTVQSILDPEQNAGEGYGLAPIGHIVTVKSAEEVTINIKTTITFQEGYTWTGLKATITETIQAYFLEIRKVWANENASVVRISQIETRILNIEGVIDVDNTKINNSASNLALDAYSVPVLGVITNG